MCKSFMLLFSLFVFTAIGYASEKEPQTTLKEMMEVGGLVTLDGYAPPKEWGHPTLEVGQVYLGANLTLSPVVKASVVVAAESDLAALWIDQALAVYAEEGSKWSFTGGQQTLKHGLLSTRLISDPLLIDEVEVAAPSLVADVAINYWTPSFALLLIPSPGIDTTNDWASVLALDYSSTSGLFSQGRLSSLLSERKGDLDLAMTLSYGNLTFDLEGFAVLYHSREALSSGCFAGLAYQLTEPISCAIRYDALSSERFKKMEQRLGLGIKMNIKDGIFCAFEIGREKKWGGRAEEMVLLQLGLENTLKLPGFQRETLTKD